MPNRALILKEQFQKSLGLPFQQLLGEGEIVRTLEEEKLAWRNRLFSPMVTIWAFLSQVIDSDHSLRKAVSRVVAWVAKAGGDLPSTDTSAYAKARKRLPERLLSRLFELTAQKLEEEVVPEDGWCGRRVVVWDGTTISTADTPSNQKEYPQHSNQAQGCGFPLLKLVVMFSLATGAALEVKIAQWRTGEVSLARRIYSQLNPGDIALADRAYGTYADLALVQQQGADGVFRKHQSRKSDFRQGEKLGIGDHIVTWHKPKSCPSGVSPETWSALPEQLQVREVHLLIRRPGFRPKEIVVVTTLLDASVYTREKLAQLYLWRWQVEVDLRHVKTTLGMDILRSKTPEMVRKEIYVHLMAYNLLRTLMWQAAKEAGICPVRVSLQGTRQLLKEFLPLLATAVPCQYQHLAQSLFSSVIRDLLPERPYRYEPRVKKRRPKPFPRLQQSRHSYPCPTGA